MFGLGENYQKLWKAIIRPPRRQYKIEDLGPIKFKKHGLHIKRTDIDLKNKKGQTLKCSHFEPIKRIRKDLPCVIYLHANSSCRLQALHCIEPLLCHQITLFALDTSGSGISDGQYISLGYYQRDDVHCVFQYLRSKGTTSSIGIWGRSMGAVTALMYADSNPQIACIVLDSPFSNLTTLCKQLAEKYSSALSTFSGVALHFISGTIKEKNNFDIEDINPLKHVKHAHIPALFIAGKDDDFVKMSHSQTLYKQYSGQKQLKIVDGGHNDWRPHQITDRISSFFYYGLLVKQLVIPDQQYIQSQKIQQELPQQKIYSHYVEEQLQIDPEQQLRLAIAQSLKISQSLPQKK